MQLGTSLGFGFIQRLCFEINGDILFTLSFFPLRACHHTSRSRIPVLACFYSRLLYLAIRFPRCRKCLQHLTALGRRSFQSCGKPLRTIQMMQQDITTKEPLSIMKVNLSKAEITYARSSKSVAKWQSISPDGKFKVARK